MATEIQEPSDLPPGSITDDNANNYEILVYEKAADAAGIKRIGIASWKDYIHFNTHKVNNVASYLGMPDDYHWDDDQDIPYEPQSMTVSNQIKTLTTKLGINSVPGTFDPLYPRFQSVENTVNGTGSPAAGGLVQRMDSAEHDINTLAEEIGSSGGASGTITGRIETLEEKVGNEASGSTQATGLIKDVRTLQNEVENESTGLIKKVDDINTILGDGTTSGLRKDVADNTQNIANNTSDINSINTTLGDGTTNGLIKKVNDNTQNIATNTSSISDINTTLGDGTTNGLIKKVNDNTAAINTINDEIGNVETEGTIKKDIAQLQDEVENPSTGLIKKVNDLASNIYRFTGSIIDAVNDGNVTTKIVLSDATQMLVPSDMGNGMVFDINPPVGTEFITLNGKNYYRGNNVAWVKLESGNGYFDELGMNIDVSEIAQLRQDVTDIQNQLDSYYKTINVEQGESWNSSGLAPGVYQFSCFIRTGSNNTMSIFIMSIEDGGYCLTEPIDVTNNFSTYWEIDTISEILKTKSALTGRDRKLNIHKIGDI